jgi:hypothetical protein
VDTQQLANVASILGLAISILVFGVGFWRIWKLQTTANEVRTATESLRKQLLAMNAVQELRASIRTLEDIRRLHRLEAWSVLPDRYTSFRHDLIAIRGRMPNLTDKQNSSIQGAIQQLSIMERQVESAIAGEEEPEVNRMNDVISKQLDRLAILVVELQTEIDRPRH